MYPYDNAKYNIVFSKLALYSLVGSLFSLFLTYNDITKDFKNDGVLDNIFKNAHKCVNKGIDAVSKNEIVNVSYLRPFFIILKLTTIPLKLLRYYHSLFKYTALILDCVSYISYFDTGIISKSIIMLKTKRDISEFYATFNAQPTQIVIFLIMLKSVISCAYELFIDSKDFFINFNDVINDDNLSIIAKIKLIAFTLPLYGLSAFTQTIVSEFKAASIVLTTDVLPKVYEGLSFVRSKLTDLILGKVKLVDYLTVISELISILFTEHILVYGEKALKIVLDVFAVITKLVLDIDISPELIFSGLYNMWQVSTKVVVDSSQVFLDRYATPRTLYKIIRFLITLIPSIEFADIFTLLGFIAVFYGTVDSLIRYMHVVSYLYNKKIDIKGANSLNTYYISSRTPEETIKDVSDLLNEIYAISVKTIFTANEVQTLIDDISAKIITPAFINNYSNTTPPVHAISASKQITEDYLSLLRACIIISYLQNKNRDAQILIDHYHKLAHTAMMQRQGYSAAFEAAIQQMKYTFGGASEELKTLFLKPLTDRLEALTKTPVLLEPQSGADMLAFYTSNPIKINGNETTIIFFLSHLVKLSDPAIEGKIPLTEPKNSISEFFAVYYSLSNFILDLTSITVLPRKALFSKMFGNILKVIIAKLSHSKTIEDVYRASAPTPIEQLSGFWFAMSRLYAISSLFKYISTTFFPNSNLIFISQLIFEWTIGVLSNPLIPIFEAIRKLFNISPVYVVVFFEVVLLIFNVIRQTLTSSAIPIIDDIINFILCRLIDISSIVYTLAPATFNLFMQPVPATDAAGKILKDAAGKVVMAPTIIQKIQGMLFTTSVSTLLFFFIPSFVIGIAGAYLLRSIFINQQDKILKFMSDFFARIADNYVLNALSGIFSISLFKFIEDYNPISLTISIIFNTFSLIFTTIEASQHHIRALFSVAMYIVKFPFVLYYNLIMVNYEIRVLIFLINKYLFGTVNKSRIYKFFEILYVNRLGLTPVINTLIDSISFFFAANTSQLEAYSKSLSEKLSQQKSIYAINAKLNERGYGVFEFDCAATHLNPRSLPDEKTIWYKSVKKSMAGFDNEQILKIMKLYSSYSSAILKEYVEEHISKIKSESGKFEALENIFEALLSKQYLNSIDYKLGLFIIHTYDLAIRSSEELKKNPDLIDAYLNKFLRMTKEFEENNANASWFSDKVANANLIANMYELMLYNISPSLVPDDGLYNTIGQSDGSKNASSIILIRPVDKVYVLRTKTKCIIKLPRKIRKNAVNQYKTITVQQFNLELSSFPKNSIKMTILETANSQTLKIYDGMTAQNADYVLSKLYSSRIVYSKIILGQLLYEKKMHINEFQSRIEAIQRQLTKMQQKIIEDNFSPDVSMLFEQFAQFVDAKIKHIKANSNITDFSQLPDFTALIKLNEELDKIIYALYSVAFDVDKEFYYMSVKLKKLIKNDARESWSKSGYNLSPFAFNFIWNNFVNTPYFIFSSLQRIATINAAGSSQSENLSYSEFASTLETYMQEIYSELLGKKVVLSSHSHAYSFERASTKGAWISMPYTIYDQWNTSKSELAQFSKTLATSSEEE